MYIIQTETESFKYLGIYILCLLQELLKKEAIHLKEGLQVGMGRGNNVIIISKLKLLLKILHFHRIFDILLYIFTSSII